MKIALAQLRSVPGDVPGNILKHMSFAESAAAQDADLVAFPELSITGYEPPLADSLATNQDDEIFDGFQKLSDEKHITIAAGMPTRGVDGVHISLIFFQPQLPRQTYSKQYLHDDELSFFTQGSGQVILSLKGKEIAPAICYESSLPEHVANAVKLGANVYLASVAKSASGIAKTAPYYPAIARKYGMPVLMVNSVGHYDNFEAVGQSSVYDKDGTLLDQLDKSSEGILFFDAESASVSRQIFS